MKIKTNVLNYKDPDTGEYTSIPVIVSDVNEEIRKDITELNEKLVQLTKIDVIWIKDKRLTSNGAEIDTSDWYITDYIEFREDVLFQMHFTISNAKGYHAYCVYDEHKNFIQCFEVDNENLELISSVTKIEDTNVKYIRFCSFDINSKHTISISDISNMKWRKGFVTSDMIADESITLEKCTFATHDKKTNYIDKTKITDGFYIQSDGTPKATSGFAITDYTEVDGGKDYYVGGGILNGYCAYYNENYECINGFDYGTNPYPITIPVNCKYVRFSINTDWYPDYKNTVWLYTENKQPKDYSYCLTATIEEKESDNPCDYNGDEIRVFRKGLCIGDSLTEGVFNYVEGNETKYLTDKTKSYPSKLSMISNIDITNLGHGGLTSSEWYDIEKDSNLSGYDFCIIQLGVNDAIRYSGWTDTSMTAFTNIINKVKTENNNIKIYVATIMPAKSYNGVNIDSVSEGIRNFVLSLNDNNVILLDMAIYAHTKDSDAYNCGHLSELGYYRLAKDYSNYISYHISKNLTQYQSVQFIGTNYIYN